MLYPITTKSRTVIDLSGIWLFKESDDDELKYEWCKHKIKDAYPIAVPASFNDQKVDKKLKYHCGWVYYQKEFEIPYIFQNQRIILRFGAVTHYAKVFLNGKQICEHKGGFLPFEVEIHQDVKFDKPNLLTVAVNNYIDYTTLPVGDESGHGMFGGAQGGINKANSKKNTPNFDFFNYAGIIRPVKIYTTPFEYIKDITLTPRILGNDALIEYEIEVNGNDDVLIEIYSEEGMLVGKGNGLKGEILINDARLWEPLNAYLYTARVTYKKDTYDQPFGIRTVETKGNKFYINGKPFYFKGFGRHEDTEHHGRGLDEVINIKDISLMKWLGANSFRTSHYPYSEEMLNLCDREGIVIIAETPAVGLHANVGHRGNNQDVDTYSIMKTFDHHTEVIRDMVARDKNHPSIVMWCIANEPDTTFSSDSAYNYFKTLYDLFYKYDKQKRPVTITSAMLGNYKNDKTIINMDVISLNRYYGWYIGNGDLKLAKKLLKMELEYWASIGKPVIFTEFGADTIAGLHSLPSTMFSEEFQVEFLKAYHEVFDEYDFVIGEHVWVFADFQTSESMLRVDGNKKGVFTRDRKPKMAAHYLKERWEKIPDYYYKK